MKHIYDLLTEKAILSSENSRKLKIASIVVQYWLAFCGSFLSISNFLLSFWVNQAFLIDHTGKQKDNLGPTNHLLISGSYLFS